VPIEEIAYAGLRWIDAEDPTEEELQRLTKEFDLHQLAVEDVRKHHQRPKLERYPKHEFLVAYSAGLEECDFFIGPDWVISIREAGDDGTWNCAGARVRFERVADDRRTPGYLLYILLDELVDGYFVVLDDLEDRIENVEDRIFADEHLPEHTIQEELFEVRRKLLLFRRVVVPLRDVASALMRGEVPWVTQHEAILFQDVFDHVLRVVDQVDLLRDLTGNAVDAQLAIASNRMNRVMKSMTSWGAILLVASLIAGFYGMNFDDLPLRFEPWATEITTASMLAVTVAGYLWFKRKDWL
jgi:magnesium transporter